MARYIVLRLEDNSTADKLLERFKAVSAINVVGIFVSPTKFCECPPNQDRKRRSSKWGTMHCRSCKLPVTSMMHSLRNQLEPIDLHPRYRDLHFSVWEPFVGDPARKYGAEAIRRTKQQVDQAKVRVKRHKQKGA